MSEELKTDDETIKNEVVSEPVPETQKPAREPTRDEPVSVSKADFDAALAAVKGEFQQALDAVKQQAQLDKEAVQKDKLLSGYPQEAKVLVPANSSLQAAKDIVESDAFKGFVSYLEGLSEKKTKEELEKVEGEAKKEESGPKTFAEFDKKVLSEIGNLF